MACINVANYLAIFCFINGYPNQIFATFHKLHVQSILSTIDNIGVCVLINHSRFYNSNWLSNWLNYRRWLGNNLYLLILFFLAKEK